MLHQRCSLARFSAALSLSAALFVVACAEGVPLDELFPTDAGHSSGQSHSGSGGSSNGEGTGSAGNKGAIDMGSPGEGGSGDNGGPGAMGSGGSISSNGGGGSSTGGGSSGGSGSSAGASGASAGSGSSGDGSGCSAPAWDSMAIYCGQGAMGTEVSLNGKKYACHYWTQAQNPEDHNSADNSEPWSTPSSCP